MAARCTVKAAHFTNRKIRARPFVAGLRRVKGVGYAARQTQIHAPPHWGRGAGRALLLHIVELAKTRGNTRLSLATGTVDVFLPAQKRYVSLGFIACGPLTNYREDPHHLFMVRDF